MPVTEPIQAGPYPEPSDPPDGPNQMAALAVWAAGRLVMRFASPAARDAAITSPVEGQEAFTGTGATSVKWRRVGTRWSRVDPVVVSTVVTSPVAITGSYTVMATAPTITTDGVQRVKITAGAFAISAASAGAATVRLADSGLAIAARNVITINGNSEGVNIFQSLVPTAGTHTYALEAASASTTPAMFGSATAPIELLVEILPG